MKGVKDICKGVNVWNGVRWESIPQRKNLSHYDPLTGILTDHEGNSYSTAVFGRAGRWMTVNLRTKTSPGSCENIYYPGELTSDDFSNRMDIRVAHYPNGSITNVAAVQPTTWAEEQGLLYSWALATNGKGGSDGQGNVDNIEGDGVNVDEYYEQKIQRQGICPDGWHLPSLAEWQELFAVLKEDAESNSDNFANYSSRPYTVGARGGATTAKSNIPLRAAQIPNGASNSAKEGGFDVLMTGAKTGNSMIYGNEASFWTASASLGVGTLTNKAAYATTFRPANTTDMVIGSAMRTFLYSVRCKQN
ncbi:FISUMP domain-containing protein [Dysgonomonas sp. Marseille-P4361]|uniref:FISUMP domain-containing protein n=1 Tax=Dysgonomonas sp. Marseille-P4361 TaxID=2161820 RepID=UPI000D553E5C|nr:FISUMP domain-containing protein [Dysgonomonas sp. Marseille-P4361]